MKPNPLFLLPLALPILLFTPEAQADEVVLCQSGKSFLKARYGACKRGERLIPFPNDEEAIARLNERVMRLEEKIGTVHDRLGAEVKRLGGQIHAIAEKVDEELREIGNRIAVVEEDVGLALRWLCPCDFHGIPFDVWDLPTVEWLDQPPGFNLCATQAHTPGGGLQEFTAYVIVTDEQNICAIEAGEDYDAGEQYEETPGIILTDAELVACVKSLQAYTAQLNAQGIAVAGGPPYECGLIQE